LFLRFDTHNEIDVIEIATITATSPTVNGLVFSLYYDWVVLVENLQSTINEFS